MKKIHNYARKVKFSLVLLNIEYRDLCNILHKSVRFHIKVIKIPFESSLESMIIPNFLNSRI